MADQKAGRSDVKHPITGAPMILDSRYTADTVAGQVVHNTALPAGARRVADAVRLKEQQFGRVYVDPVSGYRMRLKDDEAPPAVDPAKLRRTGADDQPAASAVARGGENEREQLLARLRELDGGAAGY